MVGYRDLHFYDALADECAEHNIETGENLTLAEYIRLTSSPAAAQLDDAAPRQPVTLQAPRARSASDGDLPATSARGVGASVPDIRE